MAPRNTRNTRPYGHGIHGSRHYCGALGARNIVCVFCVFSGPLSATHSGWGAPRNTRNTRKSALLWRFGGKKHRPCILCVQWSSIRSIFGLGGTTEYTEYTEGGIIVAHWGARNIVCVFCVFSGPLSATHSGWGAPRHHGIHGIPGRRHYCGALGARNIVCVFCVFSGPLSATHSGRGGDHGIPARMGTESSCEWLIVNFTGSHAACSGCCWGMKR
jgi:hypothetical protein